MLCVLLILMETLNLKLNTIHLQGKAWLALSPFMAAALVAISRTMDYRRAFHLLLALLVLTPFQTTGRMS